MIRFDAQQDSDDTNVQPQDLATAFIEALLGILLGGND
jgi:hypothetical protein